MTNTLLEIGIPELHRRFASTVSGNLSEDFFISEINYEDGFEFMKTPMRFAGYLAIFCLEGDIEVEINLKRYRIRKNSVIINVPGNIGRICEIPEDSNHGKPQFLVIAVSGEFLSGSRMDFVRLFDESMALLDNPCFSMDESDIRIFSEYHKLIRDLIDENPINLTQILRNLIGSALYYAGAVWKDKLDSISAANGHGGTGNQTTRAKLVLESFLKLVAEYHDRERGMAFYADKLCLTPKYLSKLVKSASGKSGPEWIDSFVITEAKNMLRYSDMPIKEIVYRLSFPNSSVFYKYFKSHTGQTPSEYRR